MMRVLHVVEATVGGVRTHIQALLAGLRRYGVESVVACPIEREHAFGDDQFVTMVRRASVPVVPVALRRSIHPLVDAVALLQLAALLRREHFDVVHLHSSKAGFLGRVAARLAGRPVVYSPHGPFFLSDQGPLKRRFYLTLEQLAGRLSDRIIATSPSEFQVLVDQKVAPAARVACIEYGINANPLSPTFDRQAKRCALGLADHHLTIGTLSRAAPQKNPLLFVDAAALVSHALPEAHFLWCGDGDMRVVVEARAAELGIGAQFHFLGHREDAQEILATFDLFWLTSDYESFGLATAEAMALERPVVATNVVGTRDVVLPSVTGELVPPRDPQVLAQASISLLRDPQRARAYGRAGRQRVLERFTIERMVRMTAQVYREVALQGETETMRPPVSS